MSLSRVSGLLLGVLLTSQLSFAQALENVRATFDGEKMVITYDLVFADTDQKFKVALYSSHDSYARPLSLVTGDAGDAVHSGRANRVVWDAKNTLAPDFDGEITIKIKTSKAVATAIKLSMKPFERSAYKKGQPLEAQWLGGRPTDQVNIDLLRNSEVKLRVAEKVGNAQKFTWTVPMNSAVGGGYMLRISSVTDGTEVSNSQIFEIKPKMPLWLKVLPVAVVGGVVAILLSGDKPPDDPITEEDLPGPVKPN